MEATPEHPVTPEATEPSTSKQTPNTRIVRVVTSSILNDIPKSYESNEEVPWRNIADAPALSRAEIESAIATLQNMTDSFGFK